MTLNILSSKKEKQLVYCLAPEVPLKKKMPRELNDIYPYSILSFDFVVYTQISIYQPLHTGRMWHSVIF